MSSRPGPATVAYDGDLRARRRATGRPLGTNVVIPTVAVLVLLLAVAGRYGFHRDELYFMTNAEYPAWGYVDHPPITPMLGWLSQWIFGDSLVGLRVLPAVVAAGIVGASAGIAAELGGGRGAATLTAWTTATTATILAFGHMLTTPTVDVLAWTLSIWVLCRIVRTGDQRWFVLLGAVVGLGLLNKLTTLFAVVAFGGALAMLRDRRVLLSRWTAVGVVIALVIWSPNLWWQATNGWPVTELSASIADEATENRLMTVPFQILFLGPPVAGGVVIGWWRQLRGHALRDSRFISVGFVVLLVLVIVTAGRPYYAAGALPALTAVAAVQLVDWCRRHRAVVWSMIGLNGVITALLVLPLVPVSVVVDSPAVVVNPEPLEMIGWPEFVDQIAEEYHRLDGLDGAAVILTGNYGEAGAIDRYGPARGLPPAFSGHNSYADFRRPSGSTGPVLVVGYESPAEFLTGCSQLASIVMPHEVDNEEQGAPLWRCESPRQPWDRLWPSLRHIN